MSKLFPALLLAAVTVASVASVSQARPDGRGPFAEALNAQGLVAASR